MCRCVFGRSGMSRPIKCKRHDMTAYVEFDGLKAGYVTSVLASSRP